MKKVLISVASAVLSLVLASSAYAASCWRVTGWSSPDLSAYAIVVPTSCTTVPINFSWAPVIYDNGTPPPNDLWFLFDLTDSRIEGRYLQRVLIFDHIDVSSGKPVVLGTIFIGPGDNETELLPYPPVQGVPAAGSIVRLRHRDSGNCLRGLAPNGSPIPNYVCSHDLALRFVLDAAGSGKYRLRNVNTNQCLYTYGANGEPVRSWGCWDSPDFRFSLDAASGGYRLRSMASSKCIYGDAVSGANARAWTCWADPAMVYRIDIITP